MDGESLPRRCSDVEHESMKVWATTDKHASVILLLCISNTNCGFLITFTQNRKGKLRKRVREQEHQVMKENADEIDHVQYFPLITMVSRPLGCYKRIQVGFCLTWHRNCDRTVCVYMWSLTSCSSRCDEHLGHWSASCPPAHPESRTCTWWPKGGHCLGEPYWTPSRISHPQTSAACPDHAANMEYG